MIPGNSRCSPRSPHVAGRFLTALTVLAAAAGCKDGTSQELAGVWIGVPESAEARDARESRRYASELGVPPPEESQPDDVGQTKGAAERRTDWEKYDVAVRLNFDGGNVIEMSLSEGSQSIVGQWRVVERAPGLIVVEITTPSKQSELEAKDASPGITRRRFELQPDRRDGALVGFTLTEVGADRQLGWLYFSRPGAE